MTTGLSISRMVGRGWMSAADGKSYAWWRHQMETFPRNWPFVRGIHWSPHKGQWRGALIFSLICVWINGWVNNREAGDLRRHRGHYDVIVMDEIKQIEYQHVFCIMLIQFSLYMNHISVEVQFSEPKFSQKIGGIDNEEVCLPLLYKIFKHFHKSSCFGFIFCRLLPQLLTTKHCHCFVKKLGCPTPHIKQLAVYGTSISVKFT